MVVNHSNAINGKPTVRSPIYVLTFPPKDFVDKLKDLVDTPQARPRRRLADLLF